MSKTVSIIASTALVALLMVLASGRPEFSIQPLEAQGGGDPCRFAKQFTVVRQTGNTQLITGSGSGTIFICSILIVTASTQNVGLVEGTGTTCATNPAGIMGGNTAALGLNLVANEGLAFGNGEGSITKTYTPGGNVCLLQSGSGQISGVIGYVQP